MSGKIQKFENGWFIEREVTRSTKAGQRTFNQWFRISDASLIAAAQEAEQKAQTLEQQRHELRGAERTVLISKVIEEVSGLYCRKVWWADRLELMQEAWSVVLAALDRKPCPEDLQGPYEAWLRGTVARIASRRMAQFLWEVSSPVTGARGGRQFEGLRRATLQRRGNDDASDEYTITVDQILEAPMEEGPEARITQAEAEQGVTQAREDLYWRVAELYAGVVVKHGEGARQLLLDAVMSVLCDNIPSGQAASTHGVDVRDIYAETTRIKRLIVEDERARSLLADIREWRGDLS
jgi:hypothetical protein